MLTENEVRSRLRDALEAVTPPAPWLASRIEESAEVRARSGRTVATRRGRRIGLRSVAVVALIVLVAAGVATFVFARYGPSRTIPAGPIPAGPAPSSHSRGWTYGGVAMVTATDGWGYGAPFMRTTDGGVHWKSVNPPGVGQYFQDYYLDATHAWVLDWSGTGRVIVTTYRTADGGQSWQRGAPTAIEGGLGPSGELYFLDSAHGWLLVDVSNQRTDGSHLYAANLCRTDDGGVHWQLETVHAAPPSWSTPKFYCYQWCGPMAFISATTGWLSINESSNLLVARPALLVTHDGGVTWNPQILPPVAANVNCPCSANSFVVLDELHATFLLSSVVFPWGSTAVALVITSDGGKSWVVRSLPEEAQIDVGFYDPMNGWVIAGPSEPPGLQIPQPPASLTSPSLPLHLYRTNDGGVTWTRVQTDLQLQSKDGRVLSVYFLDDRLGFATREPEQYRPWQLLKTTDGGHTWKVIASNL